MTSEKLLGHLEHVHGKTKYLTTRSLVGFMQWVPQSPFGAALSDATYSCDGKLVYASFVDGSIAVLSAHYLEPLERLAFPIYPPRGVSGYVICIDMIQIHHSYLFMCITLIFDTIP